LVYNNAHLYLQELHLDSWLTRLAAGLPLAAGVSTKHNAVSG
jgi:hypothetical protein